MFQRFSETLRFLSTIFAFSNWWISVLSPRQMSNLFWSPGWRRPPTYVCILILMVPVNSSLQCDNEKWGGDWALQTWPGLARIINILNVAVGSEGQSCLEEELGKNNRVTSGLKYYHHRPPSSGGNQRSCWRWGETNQSDQRRSGVTVWVVTETTLNPNPDHQPDRVSSEKSRAVSVCLIIHNSGRPLSLLSEWQISKKKNPLVWSELCK